VSVPELARDEGGLRTGSVCRNRCRTIGRQEAR
jgi:hypothetical protein